MSARPVSGRTALLLAFFLTGVASLVFEVVWTRLLLLSLGATSVAVGAVLGAFMGGMAIGSAFASHRFFARRDPVLTYAMLEGWAGLYGLATPTLLDSVAAAMPAVELGMAVLLLLPATIAMGASLPVLSRALGQGSAWPAVDVGHLYAANTAGAVAGPLVATFVLFPELGLLRTLHAAALVDLVVFVGIVSFRKALPPWKDATQVESRRLSPNDRPHGYLLTVLAVSGATAMVYEVAWTRTLSLVFGSSVYGVSIMLSTFLLGIAGGSALAASLLRRRHDVSPLSRPAWILVGSAVGAFGSLIIARGLPFLFVNLYRSFTERDTTLFFTQFAVSVLLMLPSTFCLGAMLPVSIDTLGRMQRDVGRQVSWLYTANLVGSAAGAITASGLLMGRFGIDVSVRIASVAALAVATATIVKARTARFPRATVTALAATMLFVAGIDPSGGPVAKGFGFYSEPGAYQKYDTSGLRQLVASHDLLYHRDGPTATVSVQRVDRYLLMKINGKTDASNGPGDTATQLLLGHLPMMAVDAKRVAIIGLGSGMTAGAVLSYDVASLDVFEIEPAVVEASHYFDEENGRPLEDPRTHLLLGDARALLRTTSVPYDLIVSEPSNPWISGVSNLFTKDFFELAASRLKPGGILGQWFHLYGMSPESTRSLLATFQSVFPHTLVFKDRDLILLGSERPIRFSVTRMEALFLQPGIQKNLSRAQVRYPFDLLADLRLDEQGVAALSQAASFNTDDNLLLELDAPRSLYRDQIETIRAEIGRHRPALLRHVQDFRSEAAVLAEFAASLFTMGRKDEALDACREALALETSFEGLKLHGQILLSLGRTHEAGQALIQALATGGDPEGRKFVEALLRSADQPFVR